MKMSEYLELADSMFKFVEFHPCVLRRLKRIAKPVETDVLCLYLDLLTTHRKFRFLLAFFDMVCLELSLSTLIMLDSELRHYNDWTSLYGIIPGLFDTAKSAWPRY
jgi:hypothetical protein